MLTKDDVERITENVLRDLSIEIDRGDWTSPNLRCIVLKYNSRELSRAYIDIVQQDEYRG